MMFTTVFFTPFWRRHPDRERLIALTSGNEIARPLVRWTWLLIVWVFSVAMLPAVARAEGATITGAKLEASEDGYQVCVLFYLT